MGQTLALPPCSPCGLHPGSPTRVAPAVHTPAPHTLTDTSCILCMQHAHQHGGLRGQQAPLPGLNICPQCAHSLPPNPLAFHPRACLQTARGRGTHRCFCTPTSSPKHYYHCQACCQLCFPDLVSNSHAVQAPAAPRGGVRGSPDSQVICPHDRSLSWGRANCSSTGLLRAEAVSTPSDRLPAVLRASTGLRTILMVWGDWTNNLVL